METNIQDLQQLLKSIEGTVQRVRGMLPPDVETRYANGTLPYHEGGVYEILIDLEKQAERIRGAIKARQTGGKG